MLTRCLSPVLARRLIAAGLLLVMTGGLALAEQLIPGWVQDHTEQWYAAFNKGDAAAMGRLYAPDAVLTLQGDVYEGRVAIEAFHRDNFGQASFECAFSIKGTTIVDRIATVWGDDTCVDTPKAGGQPRNWQGHWMTVYNSSRMGSG